MMPELREARVPKWDLPDRLRKALREEGVSVAEMAAYLDLSRETVSRYVNGKAEVPVQTVRLWALRCGVPYSWLQTGETPPSGDGGAPVVRPKGLEPLTSCSGEDQAVTWIDEYRDRRWVSSPVEAVPAAARMVG